MRCPKTGFDSQLEEEVGRELALESRQGSVAPSPFHREGMCDVSAAVDLSQQRPHERTDAQYEGC